MEAEVVTTYDDFGKSSDFTKRMQIQSNNFEIARESMIAQLRVLLGQGIITEGAFHTLCQPITDMRHYFTTVERDYYEMRNKLEEYEKQEGE